jgi:hypothetical protein
MKSRSHVGFWLIVFLCAVFVVPYLTRGEVMRGRLVAEVETVRSALGNRMGAGVIDVATVIYNNTVVASGLRAAMDEFKHTSTDMGTARKIGSEVLVSGAKAADRYFEALAMQFYAVILRGTIVGLWMLLLLPFAAAVLVDGFATRAKKFETLGFQNPTAFAASFHVLVLVSAVPFMYIVAPFSISPLFMPYWAAAAALPLSFSIQHMQPVLTR